MAVDFDNVFTGKGVWTTHKGNQNLIQYGFPVGGNNVAMIKDVAFPQTLFFAGLKNPARDFLRLRSADADNPDTSGAKRSGYRRYGVLAQHNELIPLNELIDKFFIPDSVVRYEPPCLFSPGEQRFFCIRPRRGFWS